MARWLTLSVATLFVNAAAAAEEPGELVRWETSDGGNGHWYRAVFVPERIAWVEAHLRATARGCGWYLATITSEAEDEFVFGLIADDERFSLPKFQTMVHGLAHFREMRFRSRMATGAGQLMSRSNIRTGPLGSPTI